MGIKDNCYAYTGVIVVQLITAGMSLFSKASITGGLKPSIITTYMQALGCLVLIPFAYFLERGTSCRLSFRPLCKIFIISAFGLSLNLILFFTALNYASATFVIAMDNTIPAIVFVIALLFRVEKLNLREWHGKAKVIGCAVSLSGAMVLTFLKGPALYHIGDKTYSESSTSSHTKEDWVKGFFFMFSSNLLTSLWIVAQGEIVKEYSAQLRLTVIECFFSSMIAGLWSAATQHDISSWKLGWDINLVSTLYNGIMYGGVFHWLATWVVNKRGAVFASIFTPLALAVTAFLSSLIFKEILHLGSVLGSILIVGGLYFFLWGQSKEAEDQKSKGKPKQENKGNDDITLECISTSSVPVEQDKKEANKIDKCCDHVANKLPY